MIRLLHLPVKILKPAWKIQRLSSLLVKRDMTLPTHHGYRFRQNKMINTNDVPEAISERLLGTLSP